MLSKCVYEIMIQMGGKQGNDTGSKNMRLKAHFFLVVNGQFGSTTKILANFCSNLQLLYETSRNV